MKYNILSIHSVSPASPITAKPNEKTGRRPHTPVAPNKRYSRETPNGNENDMAEESMIKRGRKTNRPQWYTWKLTLPPPHSHETLTPANAP